MNEWARTSRMPLSKYCTWHTLFHITLGVTHNLHYLLPLMLLSLFLLYLMVLLSLLLLQQIGLMSVVFNLSFFGTVWGTF